jgi:hypothetical protein
MVSQNLKDILNEKVPCEVCPTLRMMLCLFPCKDYSAYVVRQAEAFEVVSEFLSRENRTTYNIDIPEPENKPVKGYVEVKRV